MKLIDMVTSIAAFVVVFHYIFFQLDAHPHIEIQSMVRATPTHPLCTLLVATFRIVC